VNGRARWGGVDPGLGLPLRSRWRRTKAWLYAAMPSSWRPLARKVAERFGVAQRDPWAERRAVAESDPMVETYRATRPRGPLVHHIGVTVSPQHSDSAALRKAASELGGRVTFFDPDDPDWPQLVRSSGCDGHIVRLRHGTTLQRSLDENRLTLLHLEGIPAWPTPLEAYLYEDKARLAWLLQARGVPHVPTTLFAREEDALAFLERTSFPLVVKTRVGASGSGVERLDDLRSAHAYARHAFRGRPHRQGGDHRDADWGYLVVQPYREGAAEHRVVKLGDSFAAHGKVLGQNAWRYSGSGVRNWELPGWHVLDAGREAAERLGLQCAAIDFLETPEHGLEVLEVQTFFLGFRVSQMDVEGVPGIARWTGESWRFEAGTYNVHGGHALRLLAFDGALTASGPVGATTAAP
jgi:glutathione synthase/RimK-type ligase-like ATP-grasp enzyme